MKLKHTPGPWKIGLARDKSELIMDRNDIGIASPVMWPDYGRANARLIAAAPSLLEAIIISEQCGKPVKISCYDEEGIEGWRFEHPNGREWEVVCDWDEKPVHPLVSDAIESATGMSIDEVLK